MSSVSHACNECVLETILCFSDFMSTSYAIASYDADIQCGHQTLADIGPQPFFQRLLTGTSLPARLCLSFCQETLRLEQDAIVPFH